MGLFSWFVEKNGILLHTKQLYNSQKD